MVAAGRKGAGRERVELTRSALGPDPEEEAALNRAAAALERFGPGGDARSRAAVVISEWIIARTSTAARRRGGEHLLFDLADARIRGFVEAALPSIGAAVAERIDAETPFFELDKEQVIDLFVAGIEGAREAAVLANEDLGFPFSDDIPFGEVA